MGRRRAVFRAMWTLSITLVLWLETSYWMYERDVDIGVEYMKLLMHIALFADHSPSGISSRVEATGAGNLKGLWSRPVEKPHYQISGKTT